MTNAQPSRKPKSSTPVRIFQHKDWQQCAIHFLQSIRARSERTYQLYLGNLRAFFADPKKPPDTYTRADVEDYINAITHGTSQSGTPPAASTRNIRLSAIRSFYAFAADYDVPFRNSMRPLLHTPNPTRHIELLQTGGAHKTMTDDEVKNFFSVIPTDTVQGARDRALFLVFFWSGRRMAEVINLRWSDLQPTTFMDHGQMKQGYLYSWKGKGKPGRSIAEMPQAAMEAIHAYRAKLGVAADSHDYVFAGLTARGKPGAHIYSATVDYLFRRYARLAGISERHSTHSFRHTAAKVRYEEEPDIVRLSLFLGHSSVSTTMGYLEGITHNADTTAARLYSKYGKL